MTKTIAVDFDGVIHSYNRGWHDGTIYGKPIVGAFAALQTLQLDYAVAIFTTRDVRQVAKWVAEHGDMWCAIDLKHEIRFWNRQDKILVTNCKIAAIAYIDDRGIRFTDWGQALADLRRYEGAD